MLFQDFNDRHMSRDVLASKIAAEGSRRDGPHLLSLRLRSQRKVDTKGWNGSSSLGLPARCTRPGRFSGPPGSSIHERWTGNRAALLASCLSFSTMALGVRSGFLQSGGANAMSALGCKAALLMEAFAAVGQWQLGRPLWHTVKSENEGRNNRGGPLWCTRFRRVFRSRKWTCEIGQKPEEDVVWQRFSQTRQDTVVGAPVLSKSASHHSVVRVVRLGNSKLCEFPQARSVYYLCLGLLHPFCRGKQQMILLSAEAWCLEICFPPQRGACSKSLHREAH